MEIMSERLRLSIGNDLHELERLRCEVEAFLERGGVSGRTAYHIQLALDELVTNVISYASPPDRPCGIELVLERGPDAVDMTLEDDGDPFNPLQAPEPDVNAPLEARPIGGLGIHFVRKTMDQLSYERKNGRNILFIRKKTNQE